MVLKFDKMFLQKRIREEVEVISPTDLIGSVGGSLGMFFGFSFAAFIQDLIDKLIKRIQNCKLGQKRSVS